MYINVKYKKKIFFTNQLGKYSAYKIYNKCSRVQKILHVINKQR